jgi:hypothetical protein
VCYTRFANDSYPATYELMGYYSNARQKVHIITTARTSGVETHDNTTGLHFGARKVASA